MSLDTVLTELHDLFHHPAKPPITNRNLAEFLLHFERRIMTTQAELAQKIDAITDQLNKASTELSTEISTLTAAVNDAGSTSPEVDASLQRLQTIAQKLDDMNPDTPAAPAPAPAEPTASPV